MSAAPAEAARPGAPALVARRRMRLAWLLVWAGFLGFLLLCAGSAFAVYAYGTRASDARTATLERQHGGQLEVQRAGSREWVLFPSGPATTTLTLNEGDAVRTGPDTDALITLFDKSTLQIYYASEVALDGMRSSRFLDQEKGFTLNQRAGVVKYSLADRSPYARAGATVQTAQARVVLGDNTTVRVSLLGAPQTTTPYTQVVAQGGSVLVRAGATGAARPQPGEMVRAYAGGTLRSPEAASDELLANAELVTPPQAPNEIWAGWTASPGPEDTTALTGAHVITHTTESGIEPTSFELTRSSRATGTSQVVVRQSLGDRQVSFYRTLTLNLQVKIVEQPATVDPAGPYPLTVRLRYYDQDGRERTWETGFYADPTGATPGADQSDSSSLVKKGAWQKRSFDLKQLAPGNPARLSSLEIVGSGPQFSVWISQLSLIGQ